MKSVFDPIAGEEYPAANYETFQARARGCRPADGGEIDSLTDARQGSDAVFCQRATAFAVHDLAVIDTKHDWRDRVLTVSIFDLGAANARPGGAADYTDWGSIGAGVPAICQGYTGTGALSDVGTGAAVSAGNPPLAATGGGGTSYRVKFPGVNVYLYARPSDGALCLYNDTLNALHLFLTIDSTAKLARH